VPCAFPHEILGFERDSAEGILLSIAMLSESNREVESLARSNKGKQAQRYSKMYATNPQYRQHSH